MWGAGRRYFVSWLSTWSWPEACSWTFAGLFEFAPRYGHRGDKFNLHGHSWLAHARAETSLGMCHGARDTEARVLQEQSWPQTASSLVIALCPSHWECTDDSNTALGCSLGWRARGTHSCRDHSPQCPADILHVQICLFYSSPLHHCCSSSHSNKSPALTPFTCLCAISVSICIDCPLIFVILFMQNW
jgi:hypothetical protein